MFSAFVKNKCRCSLCKTFDPKGVIEGRTAQQYWILHLLGILLFPFLKECFRVIHLSRWKRLRLLFGSDRMCDILYRDDFKRSIVHRWNGLQLFCIVSDKEPYARQAHFSYELLGIWETAHLLASHQRFYISNYLNILLHFAINYSHFNNNTSANVYNLMTITTSIKHWNSKSGRILNTDVVMGLKK